jgi:hypothetical protein
MRITKSPELDNYVHKEGDLLWISSGSTANVVLSRVSTAPSPAAKDGAGAYRITGKTATGTISIDRSCLRGTASGLTATGAVYPSDFSGLTSGTAGTFAQVSVQRVTAKPYVDPHDPQQYASMQSLNAQNQDTSLLSFLPYFQYDGDAVAPFVDYRHSAMLYTFAAGAVKGRPTALSSTLVGAQVG